LWSNDAAASSTPDPRPDEPEAPAVDVDVQTERRDAEASGLMRQGAARVQHAGPRLSRHGVDLFGRRDSQRGCVYVLRSPVRRMPAVWRSRARSLALAAAVSAGACGLALAQTPRIDANVATAAELETIKG